MKLYNYTIYYREGRWGTAVVMAKDKREARKFGKEILYGGVIPNRNRVDEEIIWHDDTEVEMKDVEKGNYWENE